MKFLGSSPACSWHSFIYKLSLLLSAWDKDFLKNHTFFVPLWSFSCKWMQPSKLQLFRRGSNARQWNTWTKGHLLQLLLYLHWNLNGRACFPESSYFQHPCYYVTWHTWRHFSDLAQEMEKRKAKPPSSIPAVGWKLSRNAELPQTKKRKCLE